MLVDVKSLKTFTLDWWGDRIWKEHY
jgi:hypothetical protein